MAGGVSNIKDKDLTITKAENINVPVSNIEELANKFYSLMNNNKNENTKPSILEFKMNNLNLCAKISTDSKPNSNKKKSTFDEKVERLKDGPDVKGKLITAYEKGLLDKNAQANTYKILKDPAYKSLPNGEKIKLIDKLLSIDKEKKDPYKAALLLTVVKNNPTNQLTSDLLALLIDLCESLAEKVSAVNPKDFSDEQLEMLVQNLTSLNNTIDSFVKLCGEDK